MQPTRCIGAIRPWRSWDAGAILRLLYPAFCAGVRSAMWWRAQAKHISTAFDWLEHPAMIADTTGRTLHVSGALERLLAEDPEAELLRTALRCAIVELALAVGRPTSAGMSGAATREITTSAGRYRVCAFVLGERRTGSSGYIIAGLQCLSARAPAAEQLQARFGLTPAESRVARLIAEGRSNREIADRLDVSVHTASRHTEKVLQKLNARSRTEAATRLLG